MPNAAEVGLLMLELCDRNDFRKALNALDEGIFDDLAEPPGKAQELRGRQRLIAEKHHTVFEPGAPNGRNRRRAQLAAEIDAADLGPDCTRDRPHLDCALCHGRLCLSLRSFAPETLTRR